LLSLDIIGWFSYKQGSIGIIDGPFLPQDKTFVRLPHFLLLSSIDKLFHTASEGNTINDTS